jgi:hypothetical protein
MNRLEKVDNMGRLFALAPGVNFSGMISLYFILQQNNFL